MAAKLGELFPPNFALSFIGKKKNKQWIWLALDIETKEIVGVHIGERSREGVKGLWQSLPALYLPCAVCYTDFWSAYREIFPTFRHQAVEKTSGKTNGIGLADTLLLFKK